MEWRHLAKTKSEVPNEELKVRVVSFAEEEYRFDTLKKAVNFLSAFTEFNTEECIELLKKRKTRIGEYKFFYDWKEKSK